MKKKKERKKERKEKRGFQTFATRCDGTFNMFSKNSLCLSVWAGSELISAVHSYIRSFMHRRSIMIPQQDVRRVQCSPVVYAGCSSIPGHT